MHWRLAFPWAAVYHLDAVNSDHNPLLIDSNPEECLALRPFRFKAMWAKDPRCYDVIDDAWQVNVNGLACFKLYKKQFNTIVALNRWNKKFFGHYQSRIAELSHKIQHIQCLVASESNAGVEAKLQLERNVWLANNETMWCQKLRETWLREGDRNTRFFHVSSINMHRRNSIDAIKSDQGEWLIKLSEIREFVVNKFQDLFTEEPTSCLDDLDNMIPCSISAEENDVMYRIPTSREIKEAMFDMQSQKEVIQAVQYFFQSGHLLKEVNNSFIILLTPLPLINIIL